LVQERLEELLFLLPAEGGRDRRLLLLEGRGVERPLLEDADDGVSARRPHRLGERLLWQRIGRLLQGRRGAQLGQRLASADERGRLLAHEAERGRRLVEALLLGPRPHLRRQLARAGESLLLGEGREGLVLVLGDADDVVAEGGLHEVGGLARAEGEGGVLELGNHAAVAEAAEATALRGRALVLGAPLRQLREILARLHLV